MIRAPLLLVLLSVAMLAQQPPNRPRASHIGLKVGMLSPGPLHAITDVAGVRVGHTTLIRGEFICTGVTVVLPPGRGRHVGPAEVLQAIKNARGVQWRKAQ